MRRGASAPQNKETNRTEDGQDRKSSGDNSTNCAAGQRRRRGVVVARIGAIGIVVRRTGSVRGVNANAGGQGVNRVHDLGLNLAAADDDVGTVAGNAVDGHIDERGSGLEDVGVGRHLGNMVHNRTVVVDSISVVQLESALTHAHGMSGPTWADDHDLGVIGSGVGGTGVGRGRNGDIEVFTTVSEGLGNTSRDRTVCRIVGRIEIFNLVGGREERGQVNIDVGVGSSDHD